MKLSIFSLMILSTLMSFTVAAADCDEACQHRRTLALIQDKIIDPSNSNDQDPSCPPAGANMVANSKSFEGGLLKAKGYLQQIQQEVQKNTKALSSDQSKCGSCQQKNIVSGVSVSRPKEARPNVACNDRPTEVFTREFRSDSEAQAYIEQVMDGDNADGKQLAVSCPDPCSFYVYTGTTPLEGGASRLNLAVRCSHPRGSVFSTYAFSGSVLQEWSCRQN